MNDEYVLVYRPADNEAPSSVRTHSLEEAQRKADALNERAVLGRWTIHELSAAIKP